MAEEPGTKIKVLVRVRPLLPRELELPGCVSMPPEDPTTTILTVPKSSSHQRSRDPEKPETKIFQFDESVWLVNTQDPNYTDNRAFYHRRGPEIVDHFFQGFNVCLLAYGQTGSGKTHTMTGSGAEPGIVPLIVRDVLKHKERLISERIDCDIRLSYMEIYNEQARDLLSDNKCRVREHPITGPYVEGLQEHSIGSYDDFERFLNRGNCSRATAATQMNEKSSRSHAIITLTLKQTKFSQAGTLVGDAEEEMTSNIKLVDLAGSERLAKTKVFGQADRMKEGTLINKSLTVLGRCINLLANTTKPVVPYRDLVLTYILKENLAGNSKSFMIFCISPTDFDETYQTLNYANQVKKIRTAARANKTKITSTAIDWKELQQDNTAIESLKEEVRELTLQLEAMRTDLKFEKIVAYLEKETSRVKFENKFLKQRLGQKDEQIRELQGHVNYMDFELAAVLNEQARFAAEERARRVAELKGHCEMKMGEILTLLGEFDPNRVF